MGVNRRGFLGLLAAAPALPAVMAAAVRVPAVLPPVALSAQPYSYVYGAFQGVDRGSKSGRWIEGVATLPPERWYGYSAELRAGVVEPPLMCGEQGVLKLE